MENTDLNTERPLSLEAFIALPQLKSHEVYKHIISLYETKEHKLRIAEEALAHANNEISKLTKKTQQNITLDITEKTSNETEVEKRANIAEQNARNSQERANIAEQNAKNSQERTNAVERKAIEQGKQYEEIIAQHKQQINDLKELMINSDKIVAKKLEEDEKRKQEDENRAREHMTNMMRHLAPVLAQKQMSASQHKMASYAKLSSRRKMF